MKLSTLTREPQTGSSDASIDNGTFTAQTNTSEHVLCLNQQEALMLFGLLQAACRHEPTRRTMLSSGDYKHFHRQLSQSLADSLARPSLG